MATIVMAVCLDPEEDLDVMTEVGVGICHFSSNTPSSRDQISFILENVGQITGT